MATRAQRELFSWKEVENLGDLEERAGPLVVIHHGPIGMGPVEAVNRAALV